MAEPIIDGAEQFPALLPVRKPLSLIPVSLKEAALDSPPFRATVVHLSDQFDAIEKWLDGYVKAATKLAQEVSMLESIVGTFLTSAAPPSGISEAVLDHDYTLLTLKHYGEGAREYWSHTIGGIKKTQGSVINPIRNILQNDVKNFKEIRKQLDTSQKAYDNLLSRYYSQSKTKEPSSLREDAFQLHEAKRTYLRLSMDFCVHSQMLHAALDDLLIKVFSDQWLEMKGLRETSTTAFQTYGQEISRIRGWNKEMVHGDRVLKRELIMAKVQIEDQAEAAARPSRELDDYAASTVPFLGNRPPAFQNLTNADTPTSKQGWLYLRTLTGKPARTHWIRRWFFVKNGIFGWMGVGSRSGGVEESEKVGVLLCSVRPAFQEERRFCFEVKTKDAALMLQAESQNDLTEWMAIFDVAKQKAIEDPASTEVLATNNGNSSADPAFAVSPAIAPELAAKDDIASFLHGSETEHGVVRGGSVDHSSFRRVTARGENESGREHASRLIQKLDLHKKSTASTQVSGNTSTAGSSASQFGIASLINASHSAMPVGSGRIGSQPRKSTASTESSLAPSTLAQPPAPTNLSHTAVAIGAERGLDLGAVDTSGGVPSSVMANQWGTTNYGHLSRVERGEVKAGTQRHASSPVTAPQIGLSDASQSGPGIEPLALNASLPVDAAVPATITGHRKTISEQQAPALQRRIIGGTTDYPSYYPASLRAHDTQMRMLFPNVPPEDRTVLVFRASWNPDERQDLPGRVFVTMNELYFYSHHYGFTLVSGMQLARITDVSIARQQSHDIVYLHIEGENERADSTTIAIKTFLEPAKILQRRLKFLVSNCSAEEPATLEEALRILINLENTSSHDTESDEDDDDQSPERAAERHRQTTASGPGLRVDRSFFGADGGPSPSDANDVLKFRLPTQAVNYSPKDVSEIAVEGVFNVSAKALFHIMFGDKSVLSQMLYRDRRATNVRQYPWTPSPSNRLTRTFEYEIDQGHQKSPILDSQTIDIANDHLCYVIADTKHPWHLPYCENFSLITKVVITHIAKSRCLLRVFTSVAWARSPPFGKVLIERQAMSDLRLDAQDLYGLVSDQVQKLGPDCYTKRAIQIFGSIGQQSEVAQVTAADASLLPPLARVPIRGYTMFSLVLSAVGSLISSTASAVAMTLLGTMASIVRLLSGHSILTLLLLASVAINFFSSTQMASTWLHERSAVNLIGNLGVGPNVVLSKTIHLSDIDNLNNDAFRPHYAGRCSTAFDNLAIYAGSETHPPYPKIEQTQNSTYRRLTRSRQRMGTYRHDLLVALRLVNSIERELLQTQYEKWINDETAKCREIGMLLASDGTSKQNRTSLQGRYGYGAKQRVQAWHDGYCASCYEEHRVLSRDLHGALGRVKVELFEGMDR